MPIIPGGAPEARHRADLGTFAASVEETTKHVKMLVLEAVARKAKKAGKAKVGTLGTVKAVTANRVKAEDSARDSAEPGAVAALGHPACAGKVRVT